MMIVVNVEPPPPSKELFQQPDSKIPLAPPPYEMELSVVESHFLTVSCTSGQCAVWVSSVGLHSLSARSDLLASRSLSFAVCKESSVAKMEKRGYILSDIGACRLVSDRSEDRWQLVEPN